MSKEPTLLRWAGSKRQLLPVLATYWDKAAERYVEPFAGSAALFFRLQPRRALLGDLNSELIGAYRTLRHSAQGVLSALRTMPAGDKDFYYELRAVNPATVTAAQRAARFIYLNRFCFNGLYRTNRSGQFNVPFSGRKNGSLPPDEAVMWAARRLRSASLIHGDFGTTLALVKPGDFVYLDPPYWVSSRRVFREYDSDVFAEQHLGRLAEQLERLEDMRIPFVLSYAESSQADFLSRNRDTRRAEVRRSIAGFVGSRYLSNELIITPRYMRQ